MNERCTGEPISWLRLERFHLGEIQANERELIAEHLAACAACAACLAQIRDDDSHALPPLALPLRRKRSSRVPMRAAAVIGALAAAAAVILGLRFNGNRKIEDLSVANRIKGDAVAFSLVRDDDERITGTAGVYRDGDRFKAIVTCPPGKAAAFDVVVYDDGGASFPLEPARAFACGNEVPLPGAFRLTGDADETICLVWGEGTSVDRGQIAARSGVNEEASLCKRLTAASRLVP